MAKTHDKILLLWHIRGTLEKLGDDDHCILTLTDAEEKLRDSLRGTVTIPEETERYLITKARCSPESLSPNDKRLLRKYYPEIYQKNSSEYLP